VTETRQGVVGGVTACDCQIHAILRVKFVQPHSPPSAPYVRHHPSPSPPPPVNSHSSRTSSPTSSCITLTAVETKAADSTRSRQRGASTQGAIYDACLVPHNNQQTISTKYAWCLVQTSPLYGNVPLFIGAKKLCVCRAHCLGKPYTLP